MDDDLVSVFRSLPAAVVVLRGPEHVFTFVNDLFEQLAGGRPFLGLAVREALPEVEGQGFLELLDGVYSSGEPFVGNEVRLRVDRRGDGELDEAYVNFVYVPTRSKDGAVEGIVAHAVEVTELVRSRQTIEALAGELERERSRLAAVVDQMPAGVVLGEVPSGRLAIANRAWRAFFGVPPGDVGEIADYTRFQGYRPDGTPYQPEDYPLARSVADGEVVAGEQIDFVRAGGRRRTLEVSSAPLRDPSTGETAAAVATFFDVTDRRRAEVFLEGHGRVLELVARGAPLAEALHELSSMIERYADHELLASILVADDDGMHLRHGAAPTLPAAYNAAIDGIEIGPTVGSCGTAAHRRERVVVADIATDPLWADFREIALEHDLRACWSTPILSRRGEVLGTFALYYREAQEPPPEDAALIAVATRAAAIAIERTRLERERGELLDREQRARIEAESRARAAVSLAYIADGVCLLDNDGVVQLWNPAAEQLLGVAAGEIVGRRIADAVASWPAAGDFVPAANGTAAATVPFEVEGHERWLAISAADFEEGAVLAFRDVSGEHELEELRSDLIATVSHELRTPLAAVYGAAKTLERMELDSEHAPALVEMVGREAERLRVLVDEILDASRIEDEQPLGLTIDAVDAVAAVDAIAATMRSSGAEIELAAPPGGVLAAADEQRLRQVLTNLLDNVRKYGGNHAEIRIGAAGSNVRFEVADHGPGIPPRERERVFEKFYRLDPDLLQGVGGTGLGLYICRGLVEQMRGRIWIEPAAGGGARFVFELPRAPTSTGGRLV